MKVIFRFQDVPEIVNNGVRTFEANADDAQQVAHKERRKRLKKVCFLFTSSKKNDERRVG